MCTYCGCLEIAVMGDLAREHEEIIEVAGLLRRADEAGDGPGVLLAARALAGLLGPHTAGEERGIFRELGAVPEFADHVHSLCAEHEQLDGALDQILAGGPARHDSAVVRTFLRRLRLHIDREEDGLFPAAAIALDGAAWERISLVSLS